MLPTRSVGETMLEVALTAFATFFVIIDPIGVVPLFMALTAKLGDAARLRTAVKSVIIAAGILMFFTVVGQSLLHYLGISLPAFRIAGGVLLLLLAIDMVVVKESGIRTATDQEKAEAVHNAPDVTVFPLAIPLIAGPGAIASVILLQAEHSGNLTAQMISAGVMIGVLLLTLLGFLAAAPIMRLLGVTGVNVLTRVLGIILAALAVNNIIEGLRSSFPVLAG